MILSKLLNAINEKGLYIQAAKFAPDDLAIYARDSREKRRDIQCIKIQR
jgi:hypothetical protein